jgi:isochorismate synthase
MPNSFVIFFLPNSENGFFWQQTTEKANSLTDKEFIFSPFSNNLPTLKIVPDVEQEISLSEIDLAFKQANLEQEIEKISEPKLENKSEYTARIAKMVNNIKASRFKKIVCSRVLVEPRVSSFETIFSRLIKTYPKTFRYCFFSQESGLWMGASPEILVEQKKADFKTVSLAGTRKPDKDGAFHPFTEKEVEEQNLVTKYIKKAINNISVEPIEMSETYHFNTGNLVHLKTDINFSDTKLSALQVAKALHPTPAVCGMPLKTTQEILNINEPHRDYYTGFLGPKFSGNESRFYVNLRCMKLTQSEAFIFVGGGITALSNPEDEWDETYWKSQTMAELL